MKLLTLHQFHRSPYLPPGTGSEEHGYLNVNGHDRKDKNHLLYCLHDGLKDSAVDAQNEVGESISMVINHSGCPYEPRLPLSNALRKLHIDSGEDAPILTRLWSCQEGRGVKCFLITSKSQPCAPTAPVSTILGLCPANRVPVYPIAVSQSSHC